jgi:hypothetical protein
VLEHGDERELDRLALLVPGVGACVALCQPERLVGVGLQPHRLDERLADLARNLDARTEIDGQDLLRPSRDRVQADVRRDPVEPGTERAATLELGQAAPRPQEGFLQGVLGVLQGAEHAIAVRVELCVVLPDDVTEGVLVARASCVQQLLRAGRIRPGDSHPRQSRRTARAKLIARGAAARRSARPASRAGRSPHAKAS